MRLIAERDLRITEQFVRGGSCCVAWTYDVRGAFAQGETLEEALENLIDAVRMMQEPKSDRYRAGASNLDLDLLDADEARQVIGSTLELFEAELQDLLQIPIELVERGGLRVGAGYPRHYPDIHLCFGIVLDIADKGFHSGSPILSCLMFQRVYSVGCTACKIGSPMMCGCRLS